MKKYVLILLTCSISFCCTKKENLQKAKWNSEMFTPLILKENDSSEYSNSVDSLKSGQIFNARLFKQFQSIKDSDGFEMIKEFKGYFFKVRTNNDLGPSFEKSWKSMAQFLKQVNDTAYISIPTDSIIKYGKKQVRWKAGYRQVFFKNNADTTYAVGGTWFLDGNRPHLHQK